MKVVDYKKLYEQARWERDMLQKQLDEITGVNIFTTASGDLTREEVVAALKRCADLSDAEACSCCPFKRMTSCMEKLMAEAVKYLEEVDG